MLQVGVYHHVTGIDASSSASLAAYINTLTYSTHDKQHKVVSGLYWYELELMEEMAGADSGIAATMLFRDWICVCRSTSLALWRATVSMNAETSG